MLLPRSGVVALAFHFLSLLLSAAPQPSSAASRQADPPQELRLKVSVDQVRVDVVVTDKRGRPVPGLRAEDFEVYQDGQLQPITNLVFIQEEGQAEAPEDASSQRPSGPETIAAVPVPHVPLERHQVRRAFALVVDDLGLSFESLARARRILIQFIREQIQPGDLVALARTSQAVGALQQFTADKRQLEAAAKRLRFSFRRFGGNSEVQAAHTLSSLLFIINGLKDLPGRKSVIFLSDGLSLYAQDLTFNLASQDAAGGLAEGGPGDAQDASRPALGDAPTTSTRVADAIERVVDAATRAFVSVYAIDARGLVVGGFSAADRLPNLSGPALANRLSERSRNFFESQSGLAHLARQTGGLFYRNNNNLRKGIERALEDQRAYYLLSYQPPPEQESDPRSKKPPFRRIEVKVKRPGLKVRHRAGFLALPESADLLPDVLDPSDREAVRRRELLKILSSPFAGGQLEVRLSSLYFDDPDADSLIRVLAHVDGQALGFQQEGEGDQIWQKASVDVLIALSDLDGKVVAADDHNFVLQARGRSWQRLQEEGVIFPRTLEVEKPGGYHLKVAVRDQVSGGGGSAAHFVEVPKFRKNRLRLSGLGLMSARYFQNGLKASDVAVMSHSPEERRDSEGEATIAVLATPDSPAVRRFAAGSWLTYSLYIYNPRLERKTGRPRLASWVALFRQGRQVYRGEPRPVDPGRQKDMRRLWLAGQLGIPQHFEPGEYVLQVVVNDELAKQEHAAASQWVEFEVLPPAQ